MSQGTWGSRKLSSNVTQRVSQRASTTRRQVPQFSNILPHYNKFVESGLLTGSSLLYLGQSVWRCIRCRDDAGKGVAELLRDEEPSPQIKRSIQCWLLTLLWAPCDGGVWGKWLNHRGQRPWGWNQCSYERGSGTLFALPRRTQWEGIITEHWICLDFGHPVTQTSSVCFVRLSVWACILNIKVTNKFWYGSDSRSDDVTQGFRQCLRSWGAELQLSPSSLVWRCIGTAWALCFFLTLVCGGKGTEFLQYSTALPIVLYRSCYNILADFSHPPCLWTTEGSVQTPAPSIHLS